MFRVFYGEAIVETMTLNDVCRILKINENTGRNRLSLGLPMPPSFRVGRCRLFLSTEVEKWLSERAGLASHANSGSNDQDKNIANQ